MPSGNIVVNPSACFQPVAQLSILNLSSASSVLSEEALRRKSANEAEHCEDPLQRLRLRCLAAGMGTAKALVRHFCSSGNNVFDLDQFVHTLGTFGALSVPEQEARRIFAKISPQGSPVGVENVVEELMPPMSAPRRALVDELFHKMDPTGTGSASVSALCALFDHRRHPKFESGAKSREELLAAFLKSFEPGPDGQISAAEFRAFYAVQSAAVHNDIHFDWMLRSQWKL